MLRLPVSKRREGKGEVEWRDARAKKPPPARPPARPPAGTVELQPVTPASRSRRQCGRVFLAGHGPEFEGAAGRAREGAARPGAADCLGRPQPAGRGLRLEATGAALVGLRWRKAGGAEGFS
ncbi:hypothetical protein PVAP13_8NG226001 [Panicum virgatum]|uniref:Uncharacterized protein n=1 Tax=Panicum virgatum TaxID=38727 RepID=A0A8T0PAC5_PANVG|nr:hypothetical protein PVAP13_8NG226001 [Panicum virgatum]